MQDMFAAVNLELSVRMCVCVCVCMRVYVLPVPLYLPLLLQASLQQWRGFRLPAMDRTFTDLFGMCR